MITSQQAFEQAKKLSTVDVAALVLSATHVAARLRDLAEELRVEDPQAASQLDGLAAQLQAGLTSRPAAVWLDHWSARLKAANAKGGVR